MKPKDIVAAYDTLLDRALSIVEGAPYWQSVYHVETARLILHGSEAVLRSAETESYYDSCSLEFKETTFDASLLTMSDDSFEAWKQNETAIYNQ
ncbi:MAG: hypothetical protein ACRCU5_07055, partial [Rhizobiaceae bacterium]